MLKHLVHKSKYSNNNLHKRKGQRWYEFVIISSAVWWQYYVDLHLKHTITRNLNNERLTPFFVKDMLLLPYNTLPYTYIPVNNPPV